MVVYPRMKHLGTITCIGSLVLLSSCTLTQQHAPLPQEDTAAQQRAAQELDAALLQEEQTILEEKKAAEEAAAKAEAEKKAREEAEARAEAEEEARREAEEKARREAEEKAEAEEEARRVAEEKAREEAEARAAAEETAREEASSKATEQAVDTGEADDDIPHMLNSRRKGKRNLKPTQKIVTPTAEQQAAAYKMLHEQHRKATRTMVRKVSPKLVPAPVVEEPAQNLRSTLRVRRFAPPEEEISRGDDDAPLPNSVELRGLRSPVMKGRLPMNIDGKIIKED